MYYVPLIILVLAWSILVGFNVKNTVVCVLMGGAGGYAITTIFQHYGLI